MRCRGWGVWGSAAGGFFLRIWDCPGPGPGPGRRTRAAHRFSMGQRGWGRPLICCDPIWHDTPTRCDGPHCRTPRPANMAVTKSVDRRRILSYQPPPPIQSTPAPSPLPLLSLPPSRPFFYCLPLSSCTDDRDAIGENEGFFSVNSTETFLFSTLISFFFKKRRLWTESSRVDRERAIRRQL